MEDHYSSPSSKQRFILFISGMSPQSTQAINNLRILCDRYFLNNNEVEIIDINTDPHFASEYQIIAIPTLIRIGPLPRRTIIGDLSDNNKVLKILDIQQDLE